MWWCTTKTQRAQPRCQALFTWLAWTHLMQSLRKLLSLVPPFDRGTEVQRGWSFILEEQIAKLGCWGAEPWVFSSKLALLVGKKRGAQGTRLSPASLSKQILLPAACRLLEENINNTLFLSHSYFFFVNETFRRGGGEVFDTHRLCAQHCTRYPSYDIISRCPWCCLCALVKFTVESLPFSEDPCTPICSPVWVFLIACLIHLISYGVGDYF